MRIETQELITEYWQSVYAAAFVVCKDRWDAEDAAQDAFVKYLMQRRPFESREHIKAWLLRTAMNRAKDLSRSFFRKTKVSLEAAAIEKSGIDSAELFAQAEERMQLSAAVMALPEKYRIVVHLFYYEDASCAEIGRLLHLTEAAVRKRLSRARDMLKEALKEEWKDD